MRVFELGEGATAWPTVALGLVALSVQAASTAAGLSGLWTIGLTVLVNSVCAYAQFTVVHDAAHRCLSRVARLNEVLGYVATLTLCGPFAAMIRLIDGAYVWSALNPENNLNFNGYIFLNKNK